MIELNEVKKGTTNDRTNAVSGNVCSAWCNKPPIFEDLIYNFFFRFSTLLGWANEAVQRGLIERSTALQRRKRKQWLCMIWCCYLSHPPQWWWSCQWTPSRLQTCCPFRRRPSSGLKRNQFEKKSKAKFFEIFIRVFFQFQC